MWIRLFSMPQLRCGFIPDALSVKRAHSKSIQAVAGMQALARDLLAVLRSREQEYTSFYGATHGEFEARLGFARAYFAVKGIKIVGYSSSLIEEMACQYRITVDTCERPFYSEQLFDVFNRQVLA